MGFVYKKFVLSRKLGKVFLRFENTENDIAVRIVWPRPFSGEGSEIAFIDEKKKEVALIDNSNLLDPQSRDIALEELSLRYLFSRILKVNSARAMFGTRFWDVETNRGHALFALKDPNRNVVTVSDDHILLRDVQGNVYSIDAMSRLDRLSAMKVEGVL